MTITIPPAALEAARQAYELNEERADRDPLICAIRAALAAWPGMLVEWHSRGPFITLPLPQESAE